MKRREFFAGAAMFSAAVALPSSLNAQPVKPPKIKPPRLQKGDTIGLVAPGSGVDEVAFAKALATVKRLGFTPYYTKYAKLQIGYLAGTDAQRVEDIHHMFAKPEVKGILCVRGGYGSNRLLPLINYDLIKANPKVLMGYSDISALLFGVYSQTGLIGFHGPVAISSFNDWATQHFYRLLLEAASQVKINPPKHWKEDKDDDYKTIKLTKGRTQGELVGGNLSVITSLVGTPYDIDYTGKIVFLEEIEEPPYKIDRMLTQLLLAGKLQKAAGIALGVFKGCDLNPQDPDNADSFTLKEVLKNRLANLQIPVLYGLPFGHIADNATLPLGIQAQLDVDLRSLTVLESSVL